MEATLPYRLYLEQEAFAAERERLFTRQWFLVGRDEDVAAPGDWRRVDVVGEQLLLVRGEDERLRAFANTCRHRGAELCPVDGPESGHAGRSLRCPYHTGPTASTGGCAPRPTSRRCRRTSPSSRSAWTAGAASRS
jgi:Rieske 2Fe-2S family protein